MDLSNKATSSLDEDLEVEKSFSEDVEGRPEAQACCSNSYASTIAAGPSKPQENMDKLVEEYPTGDSDVEDGEIEPILKQPMQAPEGYPEFQYEPWQCIKQLFHKGLSIYWSLKILKNEENINEEEESRLYRCLVSYNQIQGICEAPKRIQAKHGAAVDLLGKLSKEFPNLGRYPGKVNDVFLIKQSVWGTLVRKMREQQGGEYRFDDTNEKVNNRKLFRSMLFMDTFKYEGYSYLSGNAAKLMAVKMAYEDLLKEACPLDTIYLGVEQCSKDQSLYRGVESHMIRCYDISESVEVDSENVPEQVKKTGGAQFPRREECVQVSYVKPKSGPTI